MKRKGFTLVEIIAVLVIIGLVVGIATPAVINTVNKSKKKTAEEAGIAISRAARNYYQAALLSYEQLNEIDLTGKELQYEGKKPQKGVAYFDEEGRMYAKMYYDSFCVIVDEEGTAVSEKIDIEDCKVNGVIVSFVTGDENIKYDAKEYEKGDEVGQLPTPSRDGYTFLGWYTIVDNKEEQVEDTTKIEDNVVKTIYAKWQPHQYMVTLDGQGNIINETPGWTISDGKATKIIVFGRLYDTLPKIEKTGYVFNGWYLNDKKIDSTSFLETAKDHTLVPVLEAEKYTITLKTDIGSIPETNGFTLSSVNTTNDTATKLVEYNSTYRVLPLPQKDGYTFIGWYLDNTKIEENTKVEILDNVELSAKWEGKKYTVSLDAKDGNVVPTTKEVTYGSTYGSLPIATRSGYTFIGWYLSNGTKVEENTKVEISSNHTLNAVYEEKNYTVTFVYNNGSANTTKEVTYGSTYGSLPTATKNGYTFTGWYTLGNEKIENTSKVLITENILLSAKYNANKYTVTFNPSGGNVATKTKEVTYDSTYGDLPVPTKTGYIFTGWYTMGGVLITKDSLVSNANNQTLYAQYIKNEYTVTFNPNGGTVSPTTKTVVFDNTYGDLPVPTKSGYQFNGWYTATSGGTKIESTTMVSLTSNQELYARWTANKYTVTLVYGNGSSNTTKEVTYDSIYGDLPVPTKGGYTFNGWATMGGTVITSTTKVTTASNHTITAQWGNNTYLVTFDANGGTPSVPTKNVTYDKNYGELPTATRSGYTFIGWYYNNNKIESTTNVSVLDNHSLVARWEANTYTVTFVYNNTSADTTKSVTYDSTYGDLPSPTKKGYIFNGWYTANSGGSKIESTTSVKITSAQTLYARWTANEHTVTFNPSGGSVTPSSKVVMTEFTYGDLPVPTKVGYTFNGWYTSTTDGSKIESTTVVALTTNQTLYARWTANTYTVTFVYGNGSSDTTKEVTYGSTYGDLPVPTKTGYTFNGWYTANSGGTKIESTTPVSITSAQTLYAHYTANEYTVTLRTDKGSISSTSWAVTSTNTTNDTATKKITYNTTYTDLPVLSKDGYTFNGWYYNGNKIENATTMNTASNHTLTASWTANTYTVSFDASGGNSISNKQVTYDSTYGSLETPSKDGYVFNGWYTTGGSKVESTTKVTIPSSHTLYAQWIDVSGPTLVVTTGNPSWWNYSLTVATTDPSGIKQIRYYVNDSLVYAGTNLSYSGRSNSSTVRYRIESEDNYGNITEASGTFYITICFVEGTKVLTENGLKNIEDIKVGDYVYAINMSTGVKELSKVTETFINQNNLIYEITTSNGRVIKSTEKHEYYVVDKGWVRAHSLKVGDVLQSSKGNMSIVNIRRVKLDHLINVYNFTVENNHNYLITDFEFLVHNVEFVPSIEVKPAPEIIVEP